MGKQVALPGSGTHNDPHLVHAIGDGLDFHNTPLIPAEPKSLYCSLHGGVWCGDQNLDRGGHCTFSYRTRMIQELLVKNFHCHF